MQIATLDGSPVEQIIQKFATIIPFDETSAKQIGDSVGTN